MHFRLKLDFLLYFFVNTKYYIVILLINIIIFAVIYFLTIFSSHFILGYSVLEIRNRHFFYNNLLIVAKPQC